PAPRDRPRPGHHLGSPPSPTPRRRAPGRDTTRGTTPLAPNRRRGRGGAPWGRSRSNLTGLAEERGPAADALADDRLATAPARLAFPGVDLVVQLVLAWL